MSAQGPIAGDPERGQAVAEMFDRIAPTYVRANAMLSMGVDRIWRKQALQALGACAQQPMLDLCAGTLDLTLALVAAGSPEVVAYDFSEQMLKVGQSRLPPGAPVQTLLGDAQDLPWTEPHFGGVVCGFGLRNVPDNRRTLQEALRVLLPGGRLVVLEFFAPTRADAKLFHGVFNRLVLPTVGGWISGDSQAYGYLADSMAAYLTRAAFQALAEEVGFEVESGRELLPPVASLVCLRKPRGTA